MIAVAQEYPETFGFLFSSPHVDAQSRKSSNSLTEKFSQAGGNDTADVGKYPMRLSKEGVAVPVLQPFLRDVIQLCLQSMNSVELPVPGSVRSIARSPFPSLDLRREKQIRTPEC